MWRLLAAPDSPCCWLLDFSLTLGLLLAYSLGQRFLLLNDFKIVFFRDEAWWFGGVREGIVLLISQVYCCNWAAPSMFLRIETRVFILEVMVECWVIVSFLQTMPLVRDDNLSLRSRSTWLRRRWDILSRLKFVAQSRWKLGSLWQKLMWLVCQSPQWFRLF